MNDQVQTNQVNQQDSTLEPVDGGSGHIEPVIKDTRERILALLETYPYLSRTMVQVGLGPALPPALWNPILEELLSCEAIILENVQITSTIGRVMSKAIYHLPKFPFPPITLAALEEAQESNPEC